MRTVYPECPNFLDRGNHKFGELHSAIDNQLLTEAVGAEVKHYLEKKTTLFLELACIEMEHKSVFKSC